MLNQADILNVVADPIVQTGLLAAVGALVTRVLLRGHPGLRLFGQLAFFLALTLLLLYHDIVPYEPGPANASTLERVLAILSVVAYVFNAPVGTLIATSGAVAIVLGLALQSTLGDVFSGIALNLARPYGIGDWLVLSNGIEWKVVETNWRATHLLVQTISWLSPTVTSQRQG